MHFGNKNAVRIIKTFSLLLVDGICKICFRIFRMNMNLFIKYCILTLSLFGSQFSQAQNLTWTSYWGNSSKTILTDKTNQKILGYSAIIAVTATQYDLMVKNYSQSNKILTDPVSHFSDLYGGEWGHWILWSSILTTSIAHNDDKNEIISKLMFSTFAMVTNGIITETMKRSFNRERPNGNYCKSFPSGHTSHSFTIAAISHELYGQKIGFLSYGIAMLVAISRINDNKHYLSDVIFGAGLGTAVGRAFAINYQNHGNNNSYIEISPFQIGLTIPIK